MVPQRALIPPNRNVISTMTQNWDLIPLDPNVASTMTWNWALIPLDLNVISTMTQNRDLIPPNPKMVWRYLLDLQLTQHHSLCQKILRCLACINIQPDPIIQDLVVHLHISEFHDYSNFINLIKNTCRIKVGTINKRITQQHYTKNIDNEVHPSRVTSIGSSQTLTHFINICKSSSFIKKINLMTPCWN